MPSRSDPAARDLASPFEAEPDQDLRDLVVRNPGQASFEEYRYVRETIRRRAPGNVLVFGVGRDSGFWLDANEDGTTEFVEHEPEWIAQTRKHLPGIVIHRVTYETRRHQWKRLLRRHDKLFMEDLPNPVLATNWDVIFVDSPQGASRRRPGRMKSIYTASILARRSTNVDVLVHDCDRVVEQAYSERFLGPERLVHEVRTLRHFRMRPSRDG